MNVLARFNAKSAEGWYKNVTLGKWLFVMRIGVFGWGTPMFLLVGILFPFLGLGGPTEMSIPRFAFTFALWHSGGAAFGLFTWHHNLRKYGTSPNDA